jgi:hypothetical protein
MGMKVAAVYTLCKDARIFDDIIMAGTPCPYKGKIGTKALTAWEKNLQDVPAGSRFLVDKNKKEGIENDLDDPFTNLEE